METKIKFFGHYSVGHYIRWKHYLIMIRSHNTHVSHRIKGKMQFAHLIVNV